MTFNSINCIKQCVILSCIHGNKLVTK